MEGAKDMKLLNSEYDFLYNKEDDVLDIIILPEHSYSEELHTGIYKRYSMSNERITGFTILDFNKRNISELSSQLPLEVNLNELKAQIERVEKMSKAIKNIQSLSPSAEAFVNLEPYENISRRN